MTKFSSSPSALFTEAPLRRQPTRGLNRLGRCVALVAAISVPLSQAAYAATDTWVGNTAPALFTTGFNVTPANGDTLLFGIPGSAGTSLTDNIASLTVGNTNTDGIDFGLNAGAFTIAPSAATLTLASAGTGIGINDLSLNAETISVPLTLASTQSINVGNRAGSLTLSGVISGTGFGLTKSGGGILVLSGANTFTGAVSVTGGVLSISSDGTGTAQQLGSGAAASSLVLDGGTLRTTGATTISINRTIGLGDAGGGTGGTIDTNGQASAFNGVMANNGGANSFTKTGTGTLTLGGTNTYTGNTVINQGTLKLDFNQTGAPASNIINSGSTLVLGGAATTLNTPTTALLGATLSVAGIANGNSSQAFNGVQLNPGYSTITSAAGTGTAGMLLTLGAITNNGGGIVNFTAGTPIASPSATNAITAVGTTITNGIIGAWATVGATAGTDFATLNGSNQVIALPAASYTVAGTASGYGITTAPTIASDGTKNLKLDATSTGNLTLAATGTVDVNAILDSRAAASIIDTKNGATNGILRFGPQGGVVNTTGNQLTIGTAANAGTITAGGSAVANNPGSITLSSAGGNIIVNSTIANNGTGAVSLTINQGSNGANNTALNGTNTYSGGTYIVAGRVSAPNGAVSAFGTGPVYILPGGEAIINPAVANNFFISGNGTNDGLGALRVSGTTLPGTITLQGDARIQTNGASGFTGQITGGYNLEFGGANGPFLTLANVGTANNWSGNTLINTAVLLGASNQLPDGSAAGNVTIANGATLDLKGFNETINGLTATATAGQGIVQTSATTGTSIFTVGANDQTSTFNGALRETTTGKLKLVKTGAGLLTLGNTSTVSTTTSNYTGGTQVDNGTLRFASASMTGTPLGSVNGSLTVNGGTTAGTLDLNGNNLTVGSLAGASGAASGLITSSGTGTLTLTVNNNSGTGGAGTGTTYAGVIQNGSATLGLTLASSNTATLDLTGANTYTGATTISGGSLQIGSGGSLSSSSATTLSNTASLILGDGAGPVSQTFNSLTTTSGNSIVGGAATNSTLTLNNAGTVTYANTFGGASGNQNNLNLVIAGAGPTTILSGTSTYTGSTTVNSGATLSLTGALGATAVTVNSGGALTGGGNGTTTGIIGGTLNAVGGSILTLANTSAQLKATGAITLGTAGAYNAADYSNLIFTLGGSNAAEALNTAAALTANNVFINISNPNQLGTFTLANYGSLVGGSDFSLSSTVGNTLTQNVGRNTETLAVNANNLVLTITGVGAPGLAYFNGGATVGSRTIWNNLSDPNKVNFSTNLAGTTDAGNAVGGTSDVILNATNAATNVGSATITETLGASTAINSLRVNGNATTTIGADGSTLTINAAADSNIVSDGTFVTGSQTAGVGIVIASGANAFTINTPVALGGNQSWTNNSGNLFTVNGNVTGQGATTPSTLTLANTGAGGSTLAGTLADGVAGTLALVVNNTGSGVTTLSGSSTYSGGTTLNGGTLTATGTNGLGAGNVTVNPTNATSTAADNAILNTTGSIASTAAVTVNSEVSDGGFGTGTVNFNGATPTIGSLSGNGSVVLNNASGTALTIGSTSNLSGTFSGVISNGAGTGSIVKAGTGTETLSGANTYTGGTTLNAGILKVGNVNALGTTSPTLTFGAGSTGKLQLNGNSITLTDLNTNATVGTPIIESAATSGTDTLTVNTANTDTYGGVLQNGASGTLALTKSGAGTLKLGASNTYTGGTIVTSGTLVDSSAGGTGFGSNVAASTVTVNGGATALLNVTGNNTYNYTFGGAGLVNFNFTGGGSDTTVATTAFNGFTGTLELSNPGNTANKLQLPGLTGVSGATLQIDSGATLFPGAGTNNFGAITLSGNGNSEQLGAIRIFGNSILGGNITMLTSSTIGDGGGTLTGNISSGAASGTQTLSIVNGAGASNVTFSGNISDGGTGGAVALTLNHGGDVTTLTGSNSYSGATTINTGNTLRLGDGTVGHDGTIGNTSSIINNGTLTYFRQGTVASDRVISGTGTVTKTGIGTQTLSANSTYTGATTVTAGTLIVSGSLSGTASASVAGTLEVDGLLNNAATTTVSGLLSGQGSTGAISVSSNGVLSPGLTVAGTTAGTLTAAGNVSLTDVSSTFSIRLGVAAANDGDKLALSTGNVSLGGATLQLTLGGAYATQTNNFTYVIIDGSAAGSTITGQFTQGSSITAPNGDVFNILYNENASGTGAGNDVVLQSTAIPEPETWGMLLGGLGVLTMWQRRRRAA